MKIQKIIEGPNSQRIIEYEINTERMKSLPHTFGNFRDEQEFHEAFFDQNSPRHSQAFEILEHVLKPNAIYENSQASSNEYWASGDDLKVPTGEAIFVNDISTPQKVQEIYDHHHPVEPQPSTIRYDY